MTGSSRINRFATSAAAALLACALTGTALEAQAWSHPSFQVPRTVEREFNFAVADAAGTSLLFQWREGISPRGQLGFDIGYADPDGRDTDGVLFLGGNFAWQIARESADLPLDFLLTTGLGIGVSDPGNLLRIPVGVSIGHLFELDRGMSITPYIHPRLSIDYCTDCDGPQGEDSDTELGVDFDLGVNFQVNQNLGIRFSALFGGSELLGNKDGIGISLAWTPQGLRR